MFQALTLAEVNTFALQNLFYGQNALRLSAGSVPADLVLTGSLSPMLAVDPVSVDVTAGGPPVHFTATLGGKPVSAPPLWQLAPTVGHIDADGSYTAPPQVVAPTVVQVTATDGSDSGRALLVVMPRPAVGLVVQPATRIAAAGVRLYLTVRGPLGVRVTDVSWTITPSGFGSISASGEAWAYRTPSQVTTPATVTLTASTPAGLTGAATVAVVPTVPLSVTTSQSSVNPGDRVDAHRIGHLARPERVALAAHHAGRRHPVGAARLFGHPHGRKARCRRVNDDRRGHVSGGGRPSVRAGDSDDHGDWLSERRRTLGGRSRGSADEGATRRLSSSKSLATKVSTARPVMETPGGHCAHPPGSAHQREDHH